MRVGLIACCKEKLDYPAPAEQLYQSNFFKLSKAWICPRVDEWAILSAKYGLVMPDQVIEPYDLCLANLPRLERGRWQDWVHEQLMDQWGEDVIYMVLAGYEYRRALWQMPMVEDPIDYWTEQRRQRGMSASKAAMGIGVLMKYLKSGTPYP